MKYVAFLRGINVGGRTIKMDSLRACFEELNFTNVVTILQSGNVIFDSDENSLEKLTETIETELTKRYNYPAKVIVLKIATLKTVIEKYPFASSEDRHQYVVFLSSDIGSELLQAVEPDKAVEQMALGDGAIYWQVQKGMSLDSKLAVLINKAKYKPYHTVRNINTLNKIIDKA